MSVIVDSTSGTIRDTPLSVIYVHELTSEEQATMSYGDHNERCRLIIQNYCELRVFWDSSQMSTIVDTPYKCYSVYSNDKNHITLRDILHAFDYRDFNYRVNGLANPSLLSEIRHESILDIPTSYDFISQITVFAASYTE